MALERFVESFSFDRSALKSIPLPQSSVITEATGDTKSKCVKAYEADVSRFIKNANGRIYTRGLWERVIKEQKNVWDGSLGLADHPLDEEEGSVKNAFCVWKNLHIDESTQTVKAECYLVGHYGALAQEILEAGGRIGFSSSGFGELEEDGSGRVKESTYQLERVSDWVLHPSQDVWAVKENAIETEDENDKTEVVEESAPSAQHIQENTMDKANPANKMSPKEIRKFKEDVAGWLTKAETITDLQEKLSELTEILSYFSEDVAPELKAEVEKQIKETKDKIDLAIKEHGRISEAFGTSTAEELKEGIKRVAVDTQLFERDAAEWKTIATGLQEKVQKLQSVLAVRPTNEAYKTSLDYAKKIKEDFAVREKELLDICEGAALEIAKREALNKAMANKLTEMEKKVNEANALAESYKAKAMSFFNKLKEIKVAEKKAANLVEQKRKEENALNIHPRKAPVRSNGFNESVEIEKYYEDLYKRHGEDIAPFEESIKSCDSLRDAMSLYIKVLSEMDSPKTRKISEALDPEDRKRLIEAQVGRKIRSQSDFQKRFPEGWE